MSMKRRRILVGVIFLFLIGIVGIKLIDYISYCRKKIPKDNRDVVGDAQNYFVENREEFEELYNFLKENYNTTDYDEIREEMVSYKHKYEQDNFYADIEKDKVCDILRNQKNDSLCDWYESNEYMGKVEIVYTDSGIRWISINYYDTGKTTASIQFYKIVDETYDVKQRLLQYRQLGDGWYVLYSYGV